MSGLLQIEDCLDVDGRVVLPPGVTLISLIDRNIANVGDAVAYRYLDFTRSDVGEVSEITWSELGVRLKAIGARGANSNCHGAIKDRQDTRMAALLPRFSTRPWAR